MSCQSHVETSTIEALETRIAPAAIFTYIDVDGDTVTVKTSKGTNQQLADILVPYLSLEGVANGQELQRIDFSLRPDVFQGTDLSVTAKRTNGAGDGLVNVGFIDATSTNGGTSIDLGSLTISGDLGYIVAGDATTSTPGVKSLSVGTMGRFGTDTQSGGAPSQDSFITGAVATVKVRGDIKGGSFIVGGGGKLGSLSIGGSLIGGDTGTSGFISASGGIASVKITHDLQGGAGGSSGQIFSSAKIGSVTIGGSLLGGNGARSGRLQAGSIDKVFIKGDLVGGSSGQVMMDNQTGVIESVVSIGSVTIGGSIRGGQDYASATIRAGFGSITSLTVGGDILGQTARTASVFAGGRIENLLVHGSVIGGTSGTDSGKIEASHIAKVFIGGNLQGGVNSPQSGYLEALGGIDSLIIGGSLIGGIDTDLSTNGGQEGKFGGTIVTFRIGSAVIRGSVIGKSGDFGAEIRAVLGGGKITIGGSLIGGQGHDTGEIDSLGTLGPVSIGGDLRGGDAIGINLQDSGVVTAKSLRGLTIGGSIIAGLALNGFTIARSGFIDATDDIGAITVKGSLIGNSSNSLAIVARGQATPIGSVDLAIKSLTVGGRVESSIILAGYSIIGRGLNADAQIGNVTIGGDWIASSILAGINPGGDGKIGTADDVELHGGEDFGSGPVNDSNLRTSKIASIVIKGGIYGTPGAAGSDSFGFVAQEIVAFKVGATVIPLKPGVANDVYAAGKQQPLGNR